MPGAFDMEEDFFFEDFKSLDASPLASSSIVADELRPTKHPTFLSSSSSPGIELSPTQLEVIRRVNEGNSVFFTGSAGSYILFNVII